MFQFWECKGDHVRLPIMMMCRISCPSGANPRPQWGAQYFIVWCDFFFTSVLLTLVHNTEKMTPKEIYNGDWDMNIFLPSQILPWIQTTTSETMLSAPTVTLKSWTLLKVQEHSWIHFDSTNNFTQMFPLQSLKAWSSRSWTCWQGVISMKTLW